MSRCPNCRRPVNQADQVCDFCDEPLNQGQKTQEPDQPQSGQQQSVEENTSQTSRNKNIDRSNSQYEHDPNVENDYSKQRTRQNAANSSGHTPSGRGEQRGQPSGTQTPPAPEQSGQQQQKNRVQSQSSTSNTSNSTHIDTSEDETINGVAWWVGWRPIQVIIGSTVVFSLIGLAVELTFEQILIISLAGLTIGFAIFYWGTTEINNNYVTLRNNFFERARARAEDKAGLTAADYSADYALKIGFGGSPPFVNPTERFRANYGFLTDVSLDLDLESEYSLKERGEIKTGRQRQVFYDNMEDVKVNDRGATTEIIIKTSAGDPVSFSAGDKKSAEKLMRDLRRILRENRRQRR